MFKRVSHLSPFLSPGLAKPWTFVPNVLLVSYLVHGLYNKCVWTVFERLSHSLFSPSDIQKKQPDEDCTPEPAPSSSNSQSAVFCNETSSSSSQTLSSKPASSEEPSTEATTLPAQDGEDTLMFSVLPVITEMILRWCLRWALIILIFHSSHREWRLLYIADEKDQQTHSNVCFGNVKCQNLSWRQPESLRDLD